MKCPKRFDLHAYIWFRDNEDKGSKKNQIGNLYAFSPLNSPEKNPAGSIEQICSKSPIPRWKELTLYYFDFYFKSYFYFVWLFPPPNFY